jgi:competence protein ComEC
VLGFYTLLALVMCGRRHWPVRRRLVLCMAAWMLFGLAAGARPARRPGLRCTFLAVGHGGAVLLEFPNGRTLLYDAGALDNSRRAAQIVAGCLWSRGYSRLDALVVSHADLDHFNAVPELTDTLPVGCVLAPESFMS